VTDCKTSKCSQYANQAAIDATHPIHPATRRIAIGSQRRLQKWVHMSKYQISPSQCRNHSGQADVLEWEVQHHLARYRTRMPVLRPPGTRIRIGGIEREPEVAAGAWGVGMV